MSAANDYSTLVNKESKAEAKLTSTTAAPTDTNTRTRVLTTADKHINGDRNNSYGPPTQDFQRTATYWNTHLNGVLARKLGRKMDDLDPATMNVLSTLIDTWDVAILMDLLKTSRLSWSPQDEDNWVDKAGYSACGAECVHWHMEHD